MSPRDRHRAVWAAPRHHARWGGDGPAVAAPAARDRLLINGAGDYLLINATDLLEIN